MKTLFLASVLALASVVASADPIMLLSGISPGESNNITGTNVIVTPASVWATYTQDGTGPQWISDQNTGVGGITQPNSLQPFATFYQDFFAPDSMTGDVYVWADDTAAVYLDGNLLYGPSFTPAANCVNKPIGCTQSEGLVLPVGITPGEHEFSFPLWQLYGSVSGLMYDVQLRDVASNTPEPGSAVMVGIGLGLLLLVVVGRIIAQLLNRIAESRM